MKDPWETLRIMPTRDLGEIRAAYRAHVQKFHPDKALTVEEKRRYTLRFVELQEAYRYANRMAQYEPDLQPIRIRRPPDISEHRLLSRDWFVAAIVVVVGLLEFLLLWVSVNYTPHHAVHALSMIRAIFA